LIEGVEGGFFSSLEGLTWNLIFFFFLLFYYLLRNALER